MLRAALGIGLSAASIVPVIAQTVPQPLPPAARALGPVPDAAITATPAPAAGCFPGDPLVTFDPRTKLYTLDGGVPRLTAGAYPQPMWSPTGFNDALATNAGSTNWTAASATAAAGPAFSAPANGIGTAATASTFGSPVTANDQLGLQRICRSDADRDGGRLVKGVTAATPGVPSARTLGPKIAGPARPLGGLPASAGGAAQPAYGTAAQPAYGAAVQRPYGNAARPDEQPPGTGLIRPGVPAPPGTQLQRQAVQAGPFPVHHEPAAPAPTPLPSPSATPQQQQ